MLYYVFKIVLYIYHYPWQIYLLYNYKVLALIKNISYTITTILRPKLINFSTTENELKKLSEKLLETHGFPQCVRAIDGTLIDRAGQNEH